MRFVHRGNVIAIAVVAMLAAGCAKKKVAGAPPPPTTRHEALAPAAKPASAAAQSAYIKPAAPAPAPAQRYPNEKTRARIDQLLAKIEDAYFDYDKATLRTDAQQALHADSAELRDILKDYPDYNLTIEGHCDERGSAEYNMGLGDRRAEAAKEYLVQVGIPAKQLQLISYGKEKQVCAEHDEACWQRNRRIHIVAQAQTH